MPLALVIDDDPAIHFRLKQDFKDTDVAIETAENVADGLSAIRKHSPDMVLLDVMLPDGSGIDAFRKIRENDAHLPVIFVTTNNESNRAIEAMSLGAYDYLLKPLDRQQVRELVTRAIEIRRLMETPVDLPDDAKSTSKGDTLIGKCDAMQEVYKSIGRVAAQDVTVLIQGESGTGKELVARAIFQHSRRGQGPFLAINCAAIPESLLESELFGHEKGAFTGAEQRRIGKFEQSSGGTLFLDEIGDMTPATQSKILRVLQDQSFERVGGSETIQSDVRIIAATHVNLDEAVQDDRFRQDLYYRLNVFTIHLPPLRDRREDLPLLVEHFISRFSDDLGVQVTHIAPDAMRRLQNYAWPGNVRELQSVLKQALLQMNGSVLLVDFLPSQFQDSGPATLVDQTNGSFEAFLRQRMASGSTELYAESLERMERALIVFALRHTDGNQRQAANLLGITRGSLRNKIRALDINIDRTISS